MSMSLSSRQEEVGNSKPDDQAAEAQGKSSNCGELSWTCVNPGVSKPLRVTGKSRRLQNAYLQALLLQLSNLMA